MDKKLELAARLSLSFLWIITGITSTFFAKDIGYDVLAKAGITGSFANFAIVSASVLDIAIGIWLLIGRNLQGCYLLQLLVITVYTILLSVIDASFWLHPFGPLTKNIPLMIMIYWLYRKEKPEIVDCRE